MRAALVFLAVVCGFNLFTNAAACGDESEAQAAKELLLSPRAIERPLLGQRLFPAEYELKDGNAAPILLRLPWEQTAFFHQTVPTFREQLKIPLEDPRQLQEEEVFKSLFVSELRRAAYRRTAAWEYPIGEEPAAMILLPDVQGSRDIVGRGLSVWIRRRIARGEIDEALEGVKIGLAVSRHYSRTPFVVIQLVSAAVDEMLLDRVEELATHRDCPNLYWALTALPRPLIDLRPSAELEQKFLEMSVPGLDNLDESKTPEQWRQLLDEVEKMLRFASDAEFTPEAQQQLTSRGREALPMVIEGGVERVTAMSDAEVGLRWLLHVHREQSQEITAAMLLEPPAAISALRELQTRLEESRAETGVASQMVLEKPLNIYLAAQSVQRRIDALRAVEAIRHYAAGHDSQLPESLDHIVDVVVPNDVLTGRPFQYELADGVATLSAPAIEADGKQGHAIGYAIKMHH